MNNAMINDWVDSFIRKNNAKNLWDVPVEKLRGKVEEVKATIRNEVIWRNGSSKREAAMHDGNIANLTEFLERLEEALYGESDASFEDFLLERDDEVCALADDLIRESAGSEYQHDMYYTGMVIDKAEELIPESVGSCYPFYTEEDLRRIPCYRSGDCVRERCLFETEERGSRDNLISFLTDGDLDPDECAKLCQKLREYVTGNVKPIMKEAT